MTTLSIAEFAKQNNFTQIVPSVRVNTNQYPYLTFINADNKAENIYFSKAAGENVAAGLAVTKAVTKALLSTLQVAITTNADGEERIKLISNSARVSLFDLL